MIDIVHLTRDFHNQHGIFDIHLHVDQGEVFGFLGPNGAGKTTTIRHLLGFLKPQKGGCYIHGKSCWENAAQIQRDLGYIAGEIAIFQDMRADQYFRFIEQYRKQSIPALKEELIRQFDLDVRVPIGKMSKGMKQKVAIIAAAMHDPSIYIFDEPTSGLDPVMQKVFTTFILQEKKKGKTILLSSHIFTEVEKTCDHVAMIKDGRLIALDTMQNIRNQHMHTYRVSLKTMYEAQQFAHEFGGQQDGLDVLLTHSKSLEEIFELYYGEKK